MAQNSETNRFTFYIDEDNQSTRIDSVLSLLLPETSRSFIQKLIEEGGVVLNGKPMTSKKYKGKVGDCVELTLPEPKQLIIEPEDIPLDIVYEDDDVLVVNKPKGMVVHPAVGNYTGTLVNAIMFHCADRLSSINGVVRPGIVHRIDKDTSGLLLITDDGEFAHRVISPKSNIEKLYYARVEGAPDEADVKAFEKGLTLADGTRCLPAKLEITGKDECFVTVMEGKYHQVRRMLASRGKPVKELRRLRIGSLELDSALSPGGFRELAQSEIDSIFLST